MVNRFKGFPDEVFEHDEPDEPPTWWARNEAFISFTVYSVGMSVIWFLVGYVARGTP